MEEFIETENSIHLSEYIFVIRKHKWLILFTLLAVVAITAIITLRMDPVYRASSTLIIEQNQTASPLTGERLDFESFASQALTFNTHFKLVTSKPVLDAVIKDLRLDRPDQTKDIEVSFLQQTISEIKKNIRKVLDKEAPVISLEEQHSLLIDKLKSKVKAEQVRDTRLLQISVDDRDPDQARNIANSLSRSYIEFNISNQMDSTENTLQWVKEQSYAMKKKLEDAEIEFLEYKQKEMIFSLEGKQRLISQKIEEFNDAYLETKKKRHELEANLNELVKATKTGQDLVGVQTIIESALINELYSQLVSLDTELLTLSKTLKSKHPEITKLKSNIENNKEKIREEINRKRYDMKTQLSVLIYKENQLLSAINDYEQEALKTSEKELKYNILARNVTSNQKLYDLLLAKMDETDVVQNAEISNIRIAESAGTPFSPIKPNKKINILLSVIIGLMAGFGLAFLREYMDRTIRTEEDVQDYLGFPVLTVVPVGDPVKLNQSEFGKPIDGAEVGDELGFNVTESRQ